MRSLDICLSPDLIHLYDLKGKTVVIVDILRASSCITTGIAHGIDHMVPFDSLEACRSQKEHGYVIAGERGGEKVPGFDLGNSPYSYMDSNLKGKKIAITTTNGTLAIKKSLEAAEIIIGSFLNISATVRFLEKSTGDLFVICAGWKGRVNLEDTLYAGALASSLENTFNSADDAVLIAKALYSKYESNLLEIVQHSSHAKRLRKFDVAKDIEFCLSLDQYDVNPVMQEGRIVAG